MAQAISAAAAELDMETPNQLWHGVLFYFSGVAAHEGLATQGIEHDLLMQNEKIFARYHAALFAALPAYVDGKISLEKAMLEVMKGLQSPAEPPPQ